MFVFHGYESSLIFWGAIVLIVFFSCFFSYRSRASRHRLMETLAAKGQPIPPELLENGDRHYRYERSPVQSGILLMCIGIALAVFFWALGGGGNFFEGEHIPNWLPAVGIFPFMIGLARVLGSIGMSRSPK
jgi:hypothetical protein